MATTKVKGTNAKIKELKGEKPEKVSAEDLQKLQSTINNVNQSYIELGRLAAAQHNQLHTLAGMQDNIVSLQEEMKKTYGSDDINIQDGTIKYPENGEVNKED